jgi:hypothetical protein
MAENREAQPQEIAPPSTPLVTARQRHFRRWWRFAKKHHEVLSLVGTLVTSIAAIVISWRVAQISGDQKRIQEATVLPQISVRCQEDENNSTATNLVVQNLGGPLNHLQAHSWSFITARFHAPSAGDTVLGFLPLFGFFEPMRLTNKTQGEVARAGTDISTSNAYFEEYLPATGFADSTVAILPGTVYHLVHIYYEDLLEKHHDRYIIANRRDFWGVEASASARALVDSLSDRTQAGNAIVSQGSTASWLACARRALPRVRVRDTAILRALEVRR